MGPQDETGEEDGGGYRCWERGSGSARPLLCGLRSIGSLQVLLSGYMEPRL